ncbi:hypothetical protein L484_005211 [Morus notabilis]|uniref:Uncharacterized protein n=1 Tax=Morus notabilis TaxID=981085 RepID=W9R8S2_9ROSA|nr:hypothetical protein L484_005211 [Morus notabilis]
MVVEAEILSGAFALSSYPFLRCGFGEGQCGLWSESYCGRRLGGFWRWEAPVFQVVCPPSSVVVMFSPQVMVLCSVVVGRCAFGLLISVDQSYPSAFAMFVVCLK